MKLVWLTNRGLPTAGVILHLLLVVMVMPRTRRLLRPQDTRRVDGLLRGGLNLMLNKKLISYMIRSEQIKPESGCTGMPAPAGASPRHHSYCSTLLCSAGPLLVVAAEAAHVGGTDVKQDTDSDERS